MMTSVIDCFLEFDVTTRGPTLQPMQVLELDSMQSWIVCNEDINPILNGVNNTQGASKNNKETDDKEGSLDLTNEKAEMSTNQLTVYSF